MYVCDAMRQHTCLYFNGMEVTAAESFSDSATQSLFTHKSHEFKPLSFLPMLITVNLASAPLSIDTGFVVATTLRHYRTNSIVSHTN